MEGPHLQLRVEKGPAQGKVIDRKPGTNIRIGRVVKGNTFTIKDDGISSKHLLIEFKDGKWVIFDLDTSNGTFLNTLPVEPNTPVDLKDGDLIIIGELTSIKVSIIQVQSKPKQTKGVAKKGGKTTAAAEEVPISASVTSVDNVEEQKQVKRVSFEVGENAVAPSAAVEEPRQTRGASKKVGKTAVAPPSVSVQDVEKPKQTRGVLKKVGKTAVAPSTSVEDVEEPKQTRGVSKKVGKSAVAPSPSDEDVEEPKQTKGVSENVGKTALAPSTSVAFIDDVEVVKEPDLEIGVGQVRRNPRRRGRGKEQASVIESSLEFLNKSEQFCEKPEHDNVAPLVEERPVRRRGRAKQTATRKNEPPETLSLAVPETNMVGSSLGEPSQSVPVNVSVAPTIQESSGSKIRTCDPKKLERARMTMEQLQKMTLGEWFDFMEVYLVQKINEETDTIIADMEAKAEQVKKYMMEQQTQKAKSTL